MSFGFSYINGSFSIDNNGKIPTVTGSQKVKKDIFKFIVTDWRGGLYGTKIKSIISTKLNMASADLNLKKYLKEAVYNYTLIQKTNRFLSDDETISNASLDTFVDPDDKNQLDFNLEFELKSGVIIDDLPTQTIKVGY